MWQRIRHIGHVFSFPSEACPFGGKVGLPLLHLFQADRDGVCPHTICRLSCAQPIAYALPSQVKCEELHFFQRAILLLYKDLWHFCRKISPTYHAHLCTLEAVKPSLVIRFFSSVSSGFYPCDPRFRQSLSAANLRNLCNHPNSQLSLGLRNFVCISTRFLLPFHVCCQNLHSLYG